MIKYALSACAAFALAWTPGLTVHAETLQDGESRAVLASPSPSPMEAVIDGRIWRCQETNCVALPNDGADQQSLAHECHRAAIWLGHFTSYQTGAKLMSAAELTECNARVTTTTPRSPG